MNKRTKLRFQFWDLISPDDELLAYVRWIPKTENYPDIYQPFANFVVDRNGVDGRRFDSLKEAKDFTVAYFVNKRLEEAHG